MPYGWVAVGGSDVLVLYVDTTISHKIIHKDAISLVTQHASGITFVLLVPVFRRSELSLSGLEAGVGIEPA